MKSDDPKYIENIIIPYRFYCKVN